MLLLAAKFNSMTTYRGVAKVQQTYRVRCGYIGSLPAS